MSAGAPSADDDSGQDFELNLAPIIDCFTVLITYMLVSASFISLQMLEVSAVATSDAPPPQEEQIPPEIPMALSIELKANSIIALHVTGKEKAEYTVGVLGTLDWDFDKLSAQIQAIREKWPTIKDVNVKAEPAIQYKQLVRVIERIKKDFPKVFVGE